MRRHCPLTAPFGQVSFLPTGGIGPANIADYLALPAVRAVGGSWMLPATGVGSGNWTEISRLVAEAVALAADARSAATG